MIFRYSVWILGGEILSTFIAFYIVEAGVGLVAEEEEEPKNGYPPIWSAIERLPSSIETQRKMRNPSRN